MRLTLPLLLLCLVPSAHGATAGAGTVAGVVVPPAAVDEPKQPYKGFVDPIPNPILPLRQYDPLPECIVYLEGADAPAEAAQPPPGRKTWMLTDHAFSPTIFPVVSGTSVDITNDGKNTHFLYSPNQPDLISKDPLGPSSSRTLVAVGKDVAIQIQARSAPHLVGRLVPLPTRFFAPLDRNGKFKIENVPAGRWTVKVWYRDGWLNLPSRTVEVPLKADVRIDLTTASLAGKPVVPVGPN